jgi:phosphoribosyl 1,2-cyclic phosphate phosphodiesterase
LDAVLYTHAHADHILGIDDLRPLTYFHKPNKLPLYARPEAADFIRKMFRYIFDADYKFGGLPQVELKPLTGVVELFGARFEPVPVVHGETEINGYRFGSAAYLTDHSDVPEESYAKLQGLDILFLDALLHKPHPTHSTVENSLRIVDRVKPKRAFFTHICHDLPHEETNRSLPANVQLSYDGMKLEFEI